MFKLNSKSSNEPLKQSYIIDEDVEHNIEDEGDDVLHSDTLMLAQFLSSTGPEEFSNHNSNNSSSNSKKFKKASRILSRLRKQPTMMALGSRPVTEETRKHIPLQVNYVSPLDLTGSTISTLSALSSCAESVVIPKVAAAPKETTTGVLSSPNINTNITYNRNMTNTNNNNNNSNNNNNNNSNNDNRNSFYSHHNYYNNNNNNKNYNNHTNMQQAESVVSSTMRDSGIYSETTSTLEKSSYMMINDISFPHPPPCRPEPLPPAVASAAIDAACQPSVFLTPKQLRTVPEAALKRKSVRLRHIQIQTESISNEQGDQLSCPHCRQVISPLSKRQRRLSCPPALSSGPTQGTRQLYDIISSLKLQLDQERKHRQELEKRFDQHHLSDKQEALLKEKSKWEGDCLWMNNRMALISE